MLKKLRIALAALMLVGITLLFVGIGGQWWGWMAKLQFLPACLALNLAVIAGLVLLTLLFGRLYCSVICPLGIYQDLVNRLSASRKDKKKRFHYARENKVLRYAVWLAFVVLLLAGVQSIVALLAPYSAYGRMVASIAHPHGVAVPVIAAVTFVVVTVLAWVGGRTYCNSICPVGTTLGLLSRFAIFRPVIDSEKCKRCYGCSKRCKSHCIDIDRQKIDSSRCVVCFDCLENCKLGAIKYKFAYGKKQETPVQPAPVDEGKRAFMAGAVMLGAAAAQQAKAQKLDGGLAVVLDKKIPERSERLVPFGAGSVKVFYDRCTACQLCVSNCPNHVLRPSTDLKHLMQPEMSYEMGFCRPECTKCSEVCPAGAIERITPEEKTMLHIGRAVVDYDLCVAATGEASCGNCSRHCPAGAIQMVKQDPDAPDRGAVRIPSVVEDRCIGCGACEYLCPSRPFSAIHVNGLSVHIKD